MSNESYFVIVSVVIDVRRAAEHIGRTMNGARKEQRKRRRTGFAAGMAAVMTVVWMSAPLTALAAEERAQEADPSADRQVRAAYEEYTERLDGIAWQWEIDDNGFEVIEEQMFPIETEVFGTVLLVPAVEPQYHRLVLFWAQTDGRILDRTDYLAVNTWYAGSMEQPFRSLSAVAFQDLNRDGRLDIILIAKCRNRTGAYAARDYQMGDVLFQGDGGFYRDYRISDEINRFGMNKSADCIIAYVRDGFSTKFLYTASTKAELLQNGAKVVEEQDYVRQFEKLGSLEVMPVTYDIGRFTFFMIYLIDEQGDIVWSFQPMGDYDNLYALRGIACKDIDGDGMKDLLVLGRYSNSADVSEMAVASSYEIYYQRTGGFETDTEVKRRVVCGNDDTVAGLVEKARAYWGWSPET